MGQPFGAGRPGWHIECSAMAANCSARRSTSTAAAKTCSSRTTRTKLRRAKAPTASRWRYWMHNGFIVTDNEKMSKSLGNFFLIREVLKKYDAETMRFFVVRAHYRSPLNYSDVHLDDARASLKRLYTALDLVAPADGRSTGPTRTPRASRPRWTKTSARPKRHGRAVRPGGRSQPHAVGTQAGC
jgi:cysteinyl-tRNA synthetase